MDANFASIFYEIAVLVLLAAGVGFVGLLLRQPLVVAFIAVGVLAGPDALGLVSSVDFIETLSQISIAVLLFLVGLKLDVSLVRNLGKVAVATGLGQVTFTAFFGFLICLALGLDAITSLYISIALTFSSTIIIVKLLLRQTGNRGAARQDRTGFSDCSGYFCGPCDGHTLGHRCGAGRG